MRQGTAYLIALSMLIAPRMSFGSPVGRGAGTDAAAQKSVDVVADEQKAAKCPCPASQEVVLKKLPQESPLVGISGTDVVTQKELHVGVTSRTKAMAVVFLSAKCPCSASHEVDLKKLALEFPSIAFVGVHSNVDEEPKEVADHFRRSGFSFPIVDDATQSIANKLGAIKTPHVFLIDSKGEILFEGGIDDSRNAEKATKHYLRDALLAVREGRRPEVRQVRALGCAIRRKS